MLRVWARSCSTSPAALRCYLNKRCGFFSSAKPKVDVDHERRLLTISPGDPKRHTASCIFLHGLGDTADGWSGLCQAFAVDMPHVRFVLPTAPIAPVTVNGGYRMNSWYDIWGLADKAQEPCTEIEGSQALVQALLTEEAEKLPSYHHIVLAGFSQGGALALYTGAQLRHQIGGILAMSCYLPRPRSVVIPPEALGTPILQCHGEADGVINISNAHATGEVLASKGFKSVALNAYPGLGHGANDEEIEDVRDWLMSVLPESKSDS